MTETLSRRDLFVGVFGQRGAEIRPPWAIPDPMFTDRCTACGDCVTACPQEILVRDDGGYPKVEFSHGACNFCNACRQACSEAGRLFQEYERSPWQVTPRFAESCLSAVGVTCKTCGDRCDHQAIRFRLEVGGRAQPELTVSDCTGCGACVAACPIEAIQMEKSE